MGSIRIIFKLNRHTKAYIIQDHKMNLLTYIHRANSNEHKSVETKFRESPDKFTTKNLQTNQNLNFWKNHLFFPMLYLSSNFCLISVRARARLLPSFNTSLFTTLLFNATSTL